uniref:Uncharacterized protein n=1 Tax=Arundo donax TaxID=35708 RepID=A0A0A9FQ44_ARUDO
MGIHVVSKICSFSQYMFELLETVAPVTDTSSRLVVCSFDIEV